MKYEITTDWIYLDIDKRTAAKFDAVYVQSKKLWRVPNTIGALKELNDYTKRSEFEWVILSGLIGKKEIVKSKLTKIKLLDDVPGDERLRPYQRVDVNYLAKLPHAAIFNEQRTGEQI